MLEILILAALTRKIGSIVEQKGYKSGNYKVLTVVLWFGGEILGAILGALIAGGDESTQCLIYLIALAGAAVGAGISYSIANNLAVIGPSLVQAESEKTVMLPSQGMFSAPVLVFLWLITNAFANMAWSSFYTLFNPSYEESLFNFANIASGITGGIIAGVLQWLILFFRIPNASRRILVIWIPATVLGWAIGAILYTFMPASIGMYLMVSAFTGLVIGTLQWFILKRFSKIAIWWIPANVVDWVAAWAFGQAPFMLNISNATVYSFIIGVVGTITSSIAIVFMLGKTHTYSGMEDSTS